MARTKKSGTIAGAVKLRHKRLASGQSSLYLDIYLHGKRSYEFLELYLTGDRTHDGQMMSLAETIRSRREIELRSNMHGVVPEHLLEGDFTAYLTDIATRKNHNAWDCLVKHFKSYCDGRTVTFKTLSPSIAEGFRDWLIGRFHQNTARLYYAKFKAACNQAYKKGLLVRNPTVVVDNIGSLDSPRNSLTLDEVRRLASTPCTNLETKRAFLFACYTGLRISDVRSMTWGMIRNGRLEYRQRKTSRVEYLPLSEAARKYLGEPGLPDEPVFKLPVSSNLYHGLNQWAKRAELGRSISFHVSRHTFATLTLTHGADLYTISKLMGHSSIRTTEVYAKVVDEKKERAVELIPAI